MSDFYYDSWIASIAGGYIHKDMHRPGSKAWDLVRKRFKAIENVYFRLNKLDPNILNALPPVILFVPSMDWLGLAKTMEAKPMVYLSPALELEEQSQIDFTLAHELAHVSLGHHRPYSGPMLFPTEPAERAARLAKEQAEVRAWEKAADALAASWGFKRAYSRHTRFSKWLQRSLVARNRSAM
jgi:hypothetical protein